MADFSLILLQSFPLTSSSTWLPALLAFLLYRRTYTLKEEPGEGESKKCCWEMKAVNRSLWDQRRRKIKGRRGGGGASFWSCGKRRRKTDRDEVMNTVETAESLGFCLNNQILLFMWSKLLHTATGHVQKLNGCKESEWQANGLLWECDEVLRWKLCRRAHCLLSGICIIIVLYY